MATEHPFLTKYIVQVVFPDDSKRNHPCASKPQARRTYLSALRNPIVQRMGATVTCFDTDGQQVELI
jgi:hypothetical protein